MASLKEILKNKLTKKELSQLIRSFDIIGDIAIIEIPAPLKKKEKIIAEAVMQQNNVIKTVLKKVEGRTGTYRQLKLKHLLGEKKKVTETKESGVRLKLNVEKCYYSPRLATERLRIASLVKPNEEILVMFSGVAPYPLVIAKHSFAKRIVGVELNPLAHKFALENIHLNKLGLKIQVLKGDAKKISPSLGKFDRVIMPWPKGAKPYLKIAFDAVKKNGTIHFYYFEAEEELSKVNKKMIELCKKLKRKCKILNVSKAGKYAPHVYRVCVDMRVS